MKKDFDKWNTKKKVIDYYKKIGYLDEDMFDKIRKAAKDLL